jgi:hypothetical protein
MGQSDVLLGTWWEPSGSLLETHWEPTKRKKTNTFLTIPKRKKINWGALGACWLTSLVVKNVKCLPLTKGLFKTLIECPYTFILGQKWWQTNKCRKRNFCSDKEAMHPRGSGLFLLGEGGKGRRGRWIFIFFLLFPRNSHQVPHIPNVFSNMFLIEPPFYPKAFLLSPI